ncbi:MAG: MerR family transcriptional regulator [Deltaproteobacteria bacterium]|nr:MerR family transcriptional regulator [Deltaproteobacteria bacterium]
MPTPHPAGGAREYSISDLAAQLAISPRTIRYYEERGLLAPRRTPGGQRRYTRRDRARLKLILRGKRFGYSLEEIAEMIGMADVDLDEVEQIRRSLAYGDRKLAELRERQAELAQLEKDIAGVKERLLARLEELTASEAPLNKKVSHEGGNP